MEGFDQLYIALATGFVSGFLVSMPVGPINITLINEGARRGFLGAWMVGVGGATMDMAYCSVGLAGFAQLFESHWMKVAMELISFLLLLFLGIKYWRAPSINLTSRSADAIAERVHPSTSYMTGLVRVLGNPGVLLLWITLTATFIAQDWVVPRPLPKLLCVLGVGLGAATWFALLSYGVSRGHGRFSHKTLLRLEHVSGILLICGAILVGVRLLRLLAH